MAERTKRRKSKKYKALVIVESPAKARKISEFLGPEYKVMACMGHVRDLPASASDIPPKLKKEPWATLGVNVEADFEPLYIVPKEKRKVVRELKAALKDAEELILATDEDREGESIGWHLVQLLEPKVPVKRMVFSEITREAIDDALKHMRSLDEHLVAAQETRRILDRLYGYTLSPLLWKKVRPKLSAGRVQSVAVRLLVQRELERMAFHSARYWDLKARLETAAGAQFEAQSITVDGQRLATGKDFDEHTGKLKPDAKVLLLDEAAARKLVDRLTDADWTVAKVETREQVRKPPAPFITSTLQQEANRKLGMTARDTMQVAQRLYEEGYITYMRTDSVHLSNEAIEAARKRVRESYGSEYLSPKPRRFRSTTKGAQEAHEAIRPAGTEMATAQELGLTGREARLYELIWKRTMATQMAEARLRFQTVTIQADGVEFRATGRHIVFPGFFRAYVEGSDDPEAALDDQESALPPMSEGEPLRCQEVEPVAHETKPPARYTEATLVRALEAEGIGRPSTYATIISTIQDRGYVRKVGNQLVPTFTAIAVTRLLEEYFQKLVDLGFTAQMEQRLDDIAAGSAERLPYLREFYLGREGLDRQVRETEERIDPRHACTLELDGLEAKVRVGRYGPYLEKRENGHSVTVSLPENLAPADLTSEQADKLLSEKQAGPQSLGDDPETGLPVFVRSGPYGPYVQLGEATDENPKPKRVSIPRQYDPEQITLETALALLKLPRDLGTHPETGKPVRAGIGRYGPYVVHDGKYKSLTKDDDVLTVDLPRALELLAQARTRGRAAATPLRELGPHPDDGEPVAVYEGRYGPYVKHGRINATIPKDHDPQKVTLEEAVEWLKAKAAKKRTTKKTTRRTRKSKTAAKE